MKECEYCGATLADDVLECPHCASTRLLSQCPRCGTMHHGAVCPTCIENDRIDRESAEAQRTKAEAARIANQGLLWKTALTVFLPFVGGYFLIKEDVKPGFRYFGIAWCALIALSVGTATSGSPAVKIFTSLICLAPIGLYLYKTKERFLDGGQPMKKLPLIGFALLLIVSVICGASCSSSDSATKAVEGSSAAAVADSSSSTDAAASSSSSSSSSAISAKDVKLKSKTEYLEYSDKKTDPVKLVEASEKSAKVTADNDLDLSMVGAQAIKYAVDVSGDTATQEVQFTVRDTKAPEIKFSNATPSIDQWGDFDPQSCIDSVIDVVDGGLSRVDAEPEARGTNAGLEQFYDAGWYMIDGQVDSNTPGTYSLIVKAADKNGNVSTREILVNVKEVVQETTPAPATYTYILNKNSGKFHLQGCRDVSKMKDSNKQEITATRDEMIGWGYSPCGHCNP